MTTPTKKTTTKKTTTITTKIMTRKTKRKRPSTSSRMLLAWSVVLIGLSSGALEGQKKGKQEPAHAVLAGTVFRDPGFAQPGATVVVARKETPDKKLDTAVSDARGEFAFHVPPGPL